MSSYPYSNTLRFTEDFLLSTESFFSTEDLQKLAQKISEDPLCGQKAEEIEGLFYVDWFYFSENRVIPCRVWYVANEKTPHVEVVALTNGTDDTKEASPGELDEAIRNTKKLVKLMRLFHRIVDIIRDIMNDPPDFPDFGMF